MGSGTSSGKTSLGQLLHTMDHPTNGDDAAHAASASFDIDGQPGKAFDPSTRAHLGHPEANDTTPPLPENPPNTNIVENAAASLITAAVDIADSFSPDPFAVQTGLVRTC